ncbi:MAG: HAD family phosphatase [Cyanothece sp. SIO1E1]|nr:HAD family phosphatase [Cyanothece sp. SIO1E1]
MMAPMPLSQICSHPDFKNIRLIATDMDGTLTQAGKFTPVLLQTLENLARAQIQVLIVTGRSAGWVSGLVAYLPVMGAIAENGGLFYPQADNEPELLVNLPNLHNHRQQLATTFAHLQQTFPNIRESTDNRFRITDWTFDVADLSQSDLRHMAAICHHQNWSFTYSTVQCHIKPAQQDKAAGLVQALNRHFPQYDINQVLTVGDSPNDESLFNAAIFPQSVGVANIAHYTQQLTHVPTYITLASEANGFCELAGQLLQNHSAHDSSHTA